MSDLVAWLAKILDEDERGWKLREGPLPDQMLADIAAKRAIIAFMKRVQANAGEPPNWDPDDAGALDHIARLLASAYAERPGYDESWRP